MSSVDAQFSDPLAVDKAKEDELTRKVLWKLDLHVIPVLILVRCLPQINTDTKAHYSGPVAVLPEQSRKLLHMKIPSGRASDRLQL